MPGEKDKQTERMTCNETDRQTEGKKDVKRQGGIREKQIHILT